jgi:hypothetical protein
MSKPTWMALAIALLGSACATGTTNYGQTDASVQPHHEDASHVTADAPVSKMDAAVVPDAFVPQDAPPDAASALFCTADSQCTNSGECCITLGGSSGLCGPGVVLLGVCVPQ